MIESNRFPDSRLMALVALIAKTPDVQGVIVAAHPALGWSPLVDVIYVALHAFDLEVPLVERPGASESVDGFHASRSDLFGAAIFVTVQAGLDALTIAHHFLALGLVGKIVVVNIAMLVAPHAGLAFIGRLADVQKIVRFFPGMALPTRKGRMLALQLELGALVVVEAIGLPRRLRVTVLASRRSPKFLEPLPMWVVVGMAIGAGARRRSRPQLLCVALVASDLAVGSTQIKLSTRFVVKAVVAQRATLGRVTPIATLAIK